MGATDAGGVFARGTDIVWRAGPDRVLLQRCGVHNHTSTELHGTAAFVWLALDEPATAAGVFSRLEEVEIDHAGLTDAVVLDALNDLAAAELVLVSTGGTATP